MDLVHLRGVIREWLSALVDKHNVQCRVPITVLAADVTAKPNQALNDGRVPFNDRGMQCSSKVLPTLAVKITALQIDSSKYQKEVI